ncbi:MAG: DNA polymerase IV [Clostridia bacterium]|nr:DNA polymerase IV [Clostridia bacterium]
MKERVILHCDCNSFFASVETALNPRYANVPLAVCGSEEERHGIVLAKNQLAASYGIKTAETVFSARKKCPGLVIARPHYSEYEKFSRKANEIYRRYTDMVEQFGIDESWLDVTASQKLFGSGYDIACRISRDIKHELGITVSIGVSFNKVFAKLGSDYKKPDAITVIDAESVEKIVYPLPVTDLLFVGTKTARALMAMGIRTVGDLAKTSPEMLKSRFGKNGEMLHKYAAGLDDSPVQCDSMDDAKSIGNGYTFKSDLKDHSEIIKAIDFLVEEIGVKLRERGEKCATVQITIKDMNFRSIQRQCPQEPPTDISSEIASTAFELLKSEWQSNTPIRMLTVTALNLVKSSDAPTQISMFDANTDETREKQHRSEEIVDKIRQKFGNAAIKKGVTTDD